MMSLPFHSIGFLRRMGLTAFIFGLLTVLSGAAKAETVDYLADKVLADAKINTASLHGKSVKLSDVFPLVESQTDFRFFYVADRIPLKGEMTFEGATVMSLAALFSRISLIANVVFERYDQTIIVRRAVPKSTSSAYPQPGYFVQGSRNTQSGCFAYFSAF
jgi:hypothetical protein